ncbi:MAG: flippase-like domain-containing protein [bacterium]|nr:flippase-like domain-containing protein [bacterium]
MKWETHSLLVLLGLVLLGVLLYQFHSQDVWQYLQMMGWGYGVVIGITGVAHAVNAWGWRWCFDREERPPTFVKLLRIKLSGEALGNVMPVSQVGKELVKAYMLRGQVRAGRGVPSLVLNKTMEALSGLVLVLGGTAVALHRLAFSREARIGLVVGLALTSLVIVLGVLRQRRNPCSRVLDLAKWLRVSCLERFRDRAVEVDRNLAAFYRMGLLRFVGLLGLHLAGWLLGVLEISFILYVLGHPLPLVQVLVFHALMVVINTVFCFVPAGLGVFEGGHAFLFHTMGLAPGLGLAVGMIRRIRRLFWIQVGFVLLLVGRRLRSFNGHPDPKESQLPA